MAALKELEPEFDGAQLVRTQRLIRLRGGGRIEGENASSFHGTAALVGVWFSKAEVPAELRARVALGDQFAVFLEPRE